MTDLLIVLPHLGAADARTIENRHLGHFAGLSIVAAQQRNPFRQNSALAAKAVVRFSR
jgi:hypothetical protein